MLMRILALFLLMIPGPAWAIEVILEYTSYPNLMIVSSEIGYAEIIYQSVAYAYDPNQSCWANPAGACASDQSAVAASGVPRVLSAGLIAAGGVYFWNNVGAVPGLPNYWGRLRHNGDPAYLPSLPSNAAALGVTLYRWDSTLNSGAGCWTQSASPGTCDANSDALLSVGLIQ